MNLPLINIHMHIFTAECAPATFLRVKSKIFAKLMAKTIRGLLTIDFLRWKISRVNFLLNLLGRHDREMVGRAISFLDISLQNKQFDIFNISYKVAKSYDRNSKLIALTLDMEHMDNTCSPDVNYGTQLFMVMEIKKYYPDSIFPFICVDPRSKSGYEVVSWVDKYFKSGVFSSLKRKVVPFCSGIKLYPAHGFFPFDPKLDELYGYAQENGIPLMFHCTRVGSQYIGNNIEALIPHKPCMIMPSKDSHSYSNALLAQAEIYNRIARYHRKKGWIKNSRVGANDLACDLFSHPQNYVPIMYKYPKLKICLAHMGGSEEVKYMDLTEQDHQYIKPSSFLHRRDLKELKEIWKTDGNNWAKLIRDLMVEYNNLYTDISSTIADIDDANILQNIVNWLETPSNNGDNLGSRILFGTDFYLTELSKPETNLYSDLQSKLAPWFDRMARENAKGYLSQISSL